MKTYQFDRGICGSRHVGSVNPAEAAEGTAADAIGCAAFAGRIKGTWPMSS